MGLYGVWNKGVVVANGGKVKGWRKGEGMMAAGEPGPDVVLSPLLHPHDRHN